MVDELWQIIISGTWWRLGWVDYFQPEGRGFDSRSSRHVYGPWASPLPTVACALRRKTPIQYPCCSRERLWVVEDLKGRKCPEWMNEWIIICISSLAYSEVFELDENLLLVRLRIVKSLYWTQTCIRALRVIYTLESPIIACAGIKKLFALIN